MKADRAPSSSAPPSRSTAQLRSIGEEAIIYGYPLVLMDVTREVSTNVAAPTHAASAPIDTFSHLLEFPDPSNHVVVAPNADTLYSVAFVDVTDEPMVLHVPNFAQRYFLVPMLDMWTNVFASFGTRTGHEKGGDVAVVGPGWTGTVPSGMLHVTAPTSTIWLIVRMACFGTDDFASVNALQSQLSLTPLSRWGREGAPAPNASVNSAIDITTSPPMQVAAMDAQRFLRRLAALLAQYPPRTEDTGMLDKLATVGLIPGKTFDAAALGDTAAATLDTAMRDALTKIKNAPPDVLGVRSVNGWEISTGAGTYGVNYLRRAHYAMVGLGANLPDDTVYPTAKVDAAGEPLNGAHGYTIHFAPGQTPPVSGFWSITAYEPSGYLFSNDLQRHKLGSLSEPRLMANADGSLDLRISNAQPAQHANNWLPVPNGPFYLIMRLYWPNLSDPSILDGSWNPPAVNRIGD